MKPALMVLAALLALPGPALGAEQEATTVVRSKDGLKFKVPKDWPIERRDGAVAPVPVEEYLGIKFSAVEKRLEGLEQRLEAIELRLRTLEEQRRKERISSEESSAAPP